MKNSCIQDILVLFSFASLATIIFTLNYSGFCFRESRYLSSEEQMESLFNIWNKSTKKNILIDGEYKVLERKNKYASFDEFLEKHPNCCEIDPEGGYDTDPPKLINRITGFDSGTRILLEFKEEFIVPDGNILTKEIQIVDRLQNCGESRW